MKRVTSRRGAVFLALMAVLAPGCAPAAESPQRPAGPVRLGVLVPSSGDGSTGSASPSEEGVRLAVDVVNDRHANLPLPLASTSGLPSLGGAQVSLSVDTSTQDGRQASQQIVDLVTNQHAAAVLAFGDTSELSVVSQRAEPYEVPVVGVGPSQGLLTERGLEWFFRLSPNDADYTDAFLNVLSSKPDASARSRIAVVYPADQDGAGTAFDVSEVAAQRGHDVIQVPVPPGQSASASTVAGALAAEGADGADGIILVAGDEDTASAETEAAAQLTDAFLDAGPDESVSDTSSTPVLGMGAGFDAPEVQRELGQRFPGLLIGSAWSEEITERGRVARAVSALYAERFGRPMTEEAAEAFTATYVLLRALDGAQSRRPGTLRAALLAIDLPGRELAVPWDGVSFDDMHQNVGARVVVDQMGENRVLVEPADLIGPSASTASSPESLSGSNPSSGSG